jgi:hypothetical protein
VTSGEQRDGGVADTTSVPDGWVGREVHLRYVDAHAPRSLDCTVGEVSAWGVCVDTGDETSFFPWGSMVRIDLGHSRPARGLRARWRPRSFGRLFRSVQYRKYKTV